MPRSSRMPTSHLRSNMLAPSRIIPGFQRHAHSSQIPAKALDPPPPMPRERTSRRSGREPLPMQTLAIVRSCHAARTGPSPHRQHEGADSSSSRTACPAGTEHPALDPGQRCARKNPVPARPPNTAVPAMRPISHLPSVEVQNADAAAAETALQSLNIRRNAHHHHDDCRDDIRRSGLHPARRAQAWPSRSQGD